MSFNKYFNIFLLHFLPDSGHLAKRTLWQPKNLTQAELRIS